MVILTHSLGHLKDIGHASMAEEHNLKDHSYQLSLGPTRRSL